MFLERSSNGKCNGTAAHAASFFSVFFHLNGLSSASIYSRWWRGVEVAWELPSVASKEDEGSDRDLMNSHYWHPAARPKHGSENNGWVRWEAQTIGKNFNIQSIVQKIYRKIYLTTCFGEKFAFNAWAISSDLTYWWEVVLETRCILTLFKSEVVMTCMLLESGEKWMVFELFLKFNKIQAKNRTSISSAF